MNDINTDQSLRSFIAFTLPSNLIAYCSEIRKNLIRNHVKAKWVNLENMHITIKFLGNKKETTLKRYTEILSENNFDLNLINFQSGELKTFNKQSNILFLDIIDDQNRADKYVWKILDNISQNESDKKWLPHITIGRFRKDIGRNSFLKKEFFQKSNLKFKPESISIFTSTLTSSGPIYKRFSKIA
ncbi:MAG: RNA 2',3'-cyclic phosphodiesterase [bacterium]|nr:RNA 2',3'-cyclic phosphodiesterase [bacterium]